MLNLQSNPPPTPPQIMTSYKYVVQVSLLNIHEFNFKTQTRNYNNSNHTLFKLKFVYICPSVTNIRYLTTRINQNLKEN